MKKPITHRKVDKSTERQFTEKCIPMADKHLKRYTVSLVTQEMLNNNIDFFFPPRRFAKCKQFDVSKEAKKWAYSCSVGGNGYIGTAFPVRSLAGSLRI